jgi:hypothetical protein
VKGMCEREKPDMLVGYSLPFGNYLLHCWISLDVFLEFHSCKSVDI